MCPAASRNQARRTCRRLRLGGGQLEPLPAPTPRGPCSPAACLQRALAGPSKRSSAWTPAAATAAKEASGRGERAVSFWANPSARTCSRSRLPSVDFERPVRGHRSAKAGVSSGSPGTHALSPLCFVYGTGCCGATRKRDDAAVSLVRILNLGGPTAVIEIGLWRLITDPTFDPSAGRYFFGWSTASRKLLGPVVDLLAQFGERLPAEFPEQLIRMQRQLSEQT